MSPRAPQTLAEVKALARAHRLYIVDLSTSTAPQFVLYLEQPDRNVRIGRRLVARVAGSHSGD